MCTKRFIRQFALVFTGLMFFSSFTLLAQDKGYWKLIEIKPGGQKEQLNQNVKFYVRGEPGSLTYSHEFGANGKNGISVKAGWDKFPEVLLPGVKVTIGCQAEVIKFIPAAPKWNPTVDFSIQDCWVTNSFDKKRLHGSLVRIRVPSKSAGENKLERLSDRAVIDPPEPGSDSPSYYIMKVYFGSTSGSMEYYYVYEYIHGGQAVVPFEANNEVVDQSASWKLIEIKPGGQKEQLNQNVKFYVRGEPGSLTYSHEFGANGKNGISVKAGWDKFPEVLLPGVKVTIGCQAEVIKFIPAAPKWNPTVDFSIQDCWVTNSFDKKRLHGSLVRIRVPSKSAGENKLERLSDRAVIDPPEPGSDSPSYYIMKVYFGTTSGSMEYYYIYKWQ